MSMETWEQEFYKKDASEPMTEKESIEHSILKWQGLSKKNLKKHKLEQFFDLLEDKDGDGFDIDDSSCALCQKYVECSSCPLKKESTEEGCVTEYLAFLNTGDNFPMLKRLGKALKNLDIH